jgi:hypothetical protein
MVRRGQQVLASVPLIALLLLAGCATPAGPESTPPTPLPATAPTPAPALAPRSTPKPAPAAVVPLVEVKPASILGAEESSTMLDNFTVYVSAIDGQPVGSGRAGWNTPLKLPAGPRRVTLTFVRGVFTAHAELAFTARPAAAYQVRFSTDAQVFGKNSYCEFAIVDAATGEPVVPPARAPLARLEPAK